MKISVLTIFPQFFEDFLESPIIKRACNKGVAEIEIVDIRNFAGGSFRHIDDSPFGGGVGMIMRCAPILDAVESVKTDKSHTVLFTPKGKKYNQQKARDYASMEHIILICGHYEGVDARVENHVDEQISVGDYVLTGGEIPAMLVCDSVVRLLDGVLRDGAAQDETHENGLLEYPQYTRPADYNGECVPEVLLSGHQKRIDEWRKQQSLFLTRKYRPDMFEKYELTKRDKELLAQMDANMYIRKAKLSDLDDILRVYDTARAFMRTTGNPTQWSGGYPARELLEDDINKGQLYVCQSGDTVNAVFAMIGGIDPTYVVIENGEWLNDKPYGVIHRIVSDGTQHGVLPFCVEYAKQFFDEIRIDTHNDNKVMQHLLEKNGFARCGIIHLANGDPRIAYHYSKYGVTK